MAIVEIHKGDKIIRLSADQGDNLLEVLKDNGISISNPCGGNGTCGKCKVQVKGVDSDVSQEESRLLGQTALDEGFRVACYMQIEKDLEVTLDSEEKEASIMTYGNTNSVKLCPIVTKKYIILEEASVNTSASAVTRIHYLDRLISIEKGDTRGKLYGIAADIGTTTIAVYLVNLNSGKTEKVYSCINPQKAYGDDVITRISYTIENKNGLKELNKAIIECLNKAVSYFIESINIDKSNIYSMVLTGNTTMLHLAMGLDPSSLSVSPFLPVTTNLEEFSASELSININKEAYVSFLPCVSAYVGADTLCAILVSAMLDKGESALLVDIGTNGEIALFANDRIYSCSVAAGPAFEGAHLRNGVGGVEGAIDKVFLTNNIDYTTIGNGEPIGICGSGIIDAISQLLEKGIIDETGRMLELDELPSDLDSNIKAGLIQVDGMMAFRLYKDICVTQKDIREIQNAKAAVAAGIKTLAKYSGLNIKYIEKVYLAGGFGSFINVNSALKISLLPGELTGKVTACGNAAGAGAIMALISKASFKRLEAIKEKTTYIELSGNNDFVDFYIESMMF